MPEIVVTVLPKLTLSLHITATRPDGYHELDATMVSVHGPTDVLGLSPAGRMSMTVEGPFAAGVPVDDTNLAWRAADACGERLKIYLYKEIPSGAGLGGGSADAAGVLVALQADPAIAATLGADVPFCMQGGFARVRGIGDLLEPGEVPDLCVVVATPPFGCVTADVYRAWDTLGGPQHPVNDLQPAAEHVEPRLVDFRERVEAAAGTAAFLAGSGSSYAVVFDDIELAARAHARVEAAVEGTVWATRTAEFGVFVNRPGGA